VPQSPPCRTTATAFSAAIDLDYHVQFSGTLDSSDWQESGTEISAESIDDDWERVIVADSVSTATSGRRFARVVVDLLQEYPERSRHRCWKSSSFMGIRYR
jgi:hypothetical protein